jgi:hypothetical protein
MSVCAILRSRPSSFNAAQQCAEELGKRRCNSVFLRVLASFLCECRRLRALLAG